MEYRQRLAGEFGALRCIRADSQTLLLPVCFEHIGEKTYYLFGIANVLSIPIVWALYPESNQRTLEEMDLLFVSLMQCRCRVQLPNNGYMHALEDNC